MVSSSVKHHANRGKVHVAALEGLRDRISRFLIGDTSRNFSFEDVVKDLKEKRVSYTGEEVSRPLSLSTAQIEKSFSPIGHGGTIRGTKFSKGRTRYLMENPLENLIPVRERAAGNNARAKVHIQQGEELAVFKLLETRGVITWIPAAEGFCRCLGANASMECLGF